MDSHNSIVMAVDIAGYLHLAGNMHVSPLNYFRSTMPLDATTLTRAPSMAGSEERRVTYPEFMRGPDDKLIFTYRDGSSGSGNQIYNVYDPTAQRWARLLDKPLTDGEGLRNAYFVGPVPGPDQYYHLCLVWRDTPDCATNHDVCYARSKDLLRWERGDGTPYVLPITLATAGIVDPVPVHGGIINGCTQIGFDAQQRPIVAYHKFDAAGNTQLYNARLEDGNWRVYQGTHWDYRWDFSGLGSITTEILVRPVKLEADGALTQSWSHHKYGSERWKLDPDTLAPEKRLAPEPSAIPAELRRVESSFPGMGVQFEQDSGKSNSADHHFVLRWETLEHNRDRPRDPPWPGPSMLRLYRVYDNRP